MRALVAAPDTEDRIEIRDVEDPRPASGEVVIEVRAISLNRGEMNRLSGAEPGWRPGWDIAGVVIQRTSDGGGPPIGSRVVALTSGGWAQRVAVPTDRLAAIPDSVSFEIAATLPVASLTALRCLRFGGLLLGKSVLVTGGAGGVGRFAIQLAHKAGAAVTAVAASAERAQGLTELGADTIIHDVPNGPPDFDLILESVGGSSLARSMSSVAAEGTVVTFGNSARDTTNFDVSTFYLKAAHLIGFLILDPGQAPLTHDLEYLVGLVAKQELDVQIGYTGSWVEIAPALQALRERKVPGKAVLVVEQD